MGKRLLREFQNSLSGELPNGEVFYSLREALILIEPWRHHLAT